ncbi:hypothetical protein HN51_017172, partial [Arachis hypogaea]
GGGKGSAATCEGEKENWGRGRGEKESGGGKAPPATPSTHHPSPALLHHRHRHHHYNRLTTFATHASPPPLLLPPQPPKASPNGGSLSRQHLPPPPPLLLRHNNHHQRHHRFYFPTISKNSFTSPSNINTYFITCCSFVQFCWAREEKRNMLRRRFIEAMRRAPSAHLRFRFLCIQSPRESSESDSESPQNSESLSRRIEKLWKGEVVGSAFRTWMGDGFPVHRGHVFHAINRLHKLNMNKRALE